MTSDRAARAVVSTAAPSPLGALAGALQGIAVMKLLDGRVDEVAAGKELYLDGRYHNQYLSDLRRRADCLFDHRSFAVEAVGAVTLGEALCLADPHGSAGGASLGMEGRTFTSWMGCLDCPSRKRVTCLSHRLEPRHRRCPACGGVMVPLNINLVEWLSGNHVARELLDAPLGELGLRADDVFAVHTAGGDERRYRYAAAERGAPHETTVAVAGCGNIGSHLVPHLARMPQIDRLVLVDPDTYEAANLRSQDIGAGDVGRSKVEVQAERARAINPSLEVLALEDRFENVPAGVFADAIVVGCLDSRAARMAVNRTAWRLGSTWIDAAVGEGLLARLSVYVPGPDGPCLECGWDQDDYRALEDVDGACRVVDQVRREAQED